MISRKANTFEDLLLLKGIYFIILLLLALSVESFLIYILYIIESFISILGRRGSIFIYFVVVLEGFRSSYNLYRCYRVDSGPYLPSIGLGLIGLTVYISYSATPLGRTSSIIFYTFY